jgi:hypothetical protein
MMPTATQYAPATKGRERRPLPVIALDKIIVAIPITNGVLRYREEANGLHVAGWRSAANYDGKRKPAPAKMNTAEGCQDDVARLPNKSDGDHSQWNMHTDSDEPTSKRAKKEDRPTMDDNPSNDDDRKLAAKTTLTTPQDGVSNYLGTVVYPSHASASLFTRQQTKLLEILLRQRFR